MQHLTIPNKSSVTNHAAFIILSVTFFYPRVVVGYQQNMLQAARLGAWHGGHGTFRCEEFGTL